MGEYLPRRLWNPRNCTCLTIVSAGFSTKVRTMMCCERSSFCRHTLRFSSTIRRWFTELGQYCVCGNVCFTYYWSTNSEGVNCHPAAVGVRVSPRLTTCSSLLASLSKTIRLAWVLSIIFQNCCRLFSNGICVTMYASCLRYPCEQQVTEGEGEVVFLSGQCDLLWHWAQVLRIGQVDLRSHRRRSRTRSDWAEWLERSRLWRSWGEGRGRVS